MCTQQYDSNHAAAQGSTEALAIPDYCCKQQWQLQQQYLGGFCTTTAAHCRAKVTTTAR